MTNTKTLAALVFPGDLEQYVANARTAGDSWRTIADNVNARLDGKLSVTHESLRTWFAQAAA